MQNQTRTVTDAETELRANLTALINAGAGSDEIIKAAEAVATQIIEAAEAESALRFTGHAWTQEQRDALSAKLRGRPGKPWSEETRAKMAGVWTDEKKAALSEKLKGRVVPEDQKEKIRAAAQKRKQDSESMKARLAFLEAQLADGKLPVTPASVEIPADSDTEDVSKPRGRRR